MDKSKTVFCTDRRQWRSWLSAHFETEDEVWFVFPTKDSGETGVTYNDAVEEALCFGWIDGQAGTLDETQAQAVYPAQEGQRLFAPQRGTPDLAGRAGADPPENKSGR